MKPAIDPLQRVFVALTALLGVGLAVLAPASGETFTVGFLMALFAIVVASIVVRAPLGPGSVDGVSAHSAITRFVPIGSQSDPDARGHARPRAPGTLLPAI